MVTEQATQAERLQIPSSGKSVEPDRNVLIVDPDDRFAVILRRALGGGYSLRHVSTIEDGVSAVRENTVDVTLLNWDWPNIKTGVEDPRELLLREASGQTVPIPVLAFTWDRRREAAMQIVKSGAFDVFAQPLDVLELKFSLDQAHRRVQLARDLLAARTMAPFSHIPGLIGNSKSMQRIYELVTKVAGVFTTVLIRGESGTGKELIARA
ncbi:MAG TPA: sigma 54-interacting transcriptional regulator, partial [Terriglobia bacterium]|nr:sigma 54-interacting transcriptional regulator [Terriglobia bacterium]